MLLCHYSLSASDKVTPTHLNPRRPASGSAGTEGGSMSTSTGATAPVTTLLQLKTAR